MSNQFPTLHIVDHPLVQHKLSVMRDKNTSVKDFRALVGEIAMLLTYEATRDLPMTTRTIETPICSYEAPTVIDGAALGSGTEEVPQGLYVTPRDIDRQVRQLGRLLGYGISLAVQPGLTAEDLAALAE